FTPITSTLHPQVAALIAALEGQGALGAAMTGTGATVFAYFDSQPDALRACNNLQSKSHFRGAKFFVTQTR
ncbi:MAG: hypothetical protein FWG38_02080, partial [Defluviitaleaceae bacterium]|nr:hypothetical protein [Defluviitaleaceae bacterium]